MAEGSIVFISDELINKMMKADHLITDMATKSEQAQARIVAAFKKMGDDGVGHFIQKLHEAQAKINALSGGSINIKATGLENISSQAAKSADDVNKLYEVITKLAEANENLAKKKNTSKKEVTEEERANKEFERIQKEKAKIAEKAAKEYEQAYLKADEDLIKSSDKRMRQVIEQINRQEEARRKAIQSQQGTNTPRTTDSHIAEYSYNLKRITELNEKMKELVASTRQYEFIKKRIESGKGGIITRQQTEEYNANLKNIDAIKQQIATYRQRNQAIVNDNHAMQAQIRFKQEMQNMSAKDRESAEILAKMGEYYRQQAVEAERLAKAKNTTYADAMQYSTNAKTYIEEKQAIEQLAQARNNLSKNDADFAAKRNALTEAINRHKESLKQSGKTDAQIAEEAKQAAEKRRIAAMRETEAYERRKKAVMDKWYSSSADRALNFSASTKSINEQIQAIKYLQIARSNLSKGNMTDEQYRQKVKQINDEIKRQQQEVDKLVGKNNQLSNSHRNLMDISGQLARKLALVFSVSQIQGYINKLAQVRGEFELQQRSLQVLLQNKDEANKLWQQTVELAVKSPFRVGELVSYTRQLAAYRIETDKLHETTKRLADVSAGLGVDMNRLILAYGQVRAAEYLRGTELRQFTEAGIPMLDELAKRFSALEGRMITAGDVFERISKRMVSFKDVAAVFDTMTSAGGTFYRMQEQQSETLKGQISNLHDAIDLMLNDIGRSNEGILKGSVQLARSFVDNWKEIAFIVEKIAYSLAAHKLAMLAYNTGVKNAATSTLWWNTALKTKIGTTMADIRTLSWHEAKILGVTRAQYMAGKATLYFQGALRGVGIALKTIAPFLAIGLILELWRRMTEASRAAEELRKNLNKLVNEDYSNVETLSENYKSLVTQLRNANEGSKERRDIIAKLNSQYGEYLDMVVDEKTNVNDLATAYEEVLKRMKEKAALSTMEKGLNTIAESYGSKLDKAEEKFRNLFKGASIKKLDDDFGYIIPTEDDIDNVMSLLQTRIRELDAEQMDSLQEQQEIIQEIIKQYYGQDFYLGRDYSKSINLIDILVEKKKEEEKLEKRINIQYKETLKSREANLALEKLNNEYKKKQIDINNEANLSDFEVRQKLEKAKEQYELDKIELKLQFGEISETEAQRAKERILNWATDTVKDVNEKLRLDKELFGYTEEQMATIYISQEEQAQGMAAVIKHTIDGWNTANEIIAEQISLKSAGLSIDEKTLKKYQDQEVLFRQRAKALGIELKYVTKINEETWKSINAKLPNEYKITLEDSYKSIDTLLDDYTKKENESLTLLKRIYEQKQKGLEVDNSQVKKLEEQIEQYREIRKMLGEVIEPSISKESLNTINALLPTEYQINFADSMKSVTELQNDANTAKEKAIKLNETYQNQIAQGIPVEDELIKKTKADIEWYTKKWQYLGGIEEDKKKGRSNSLYDERIKVIDDMNKKYKEINKTLDKTEALQGAFNAYVDAFATAYNEISWIPKNVRQMTAEEFATQVLNFPNEDALVAFLDKLSKEPMKTFEKIKVELAKGKYVYDMKVNAKVFDDKELTSQIEDLFSGYELSIELDKMNVPADMAKDLFDIDATSLDELKAELQNFKPLFIGTDMEEKYKKYLDKISDMEDKARMDNLEKYTKYLLKSQSERVRIKLEEARQIAEIEKLTGVSNDAKQTMMLGVQEETQAKMDKQAWAEFKDTAMYVDMFKNLDAVSIRTLKRMKDELERLRSSMSDLSSTEMKEIVSRMNEIDSMIAKKNPFDGLASGIFKAIKATSQYKKAQDNVIQRQADVNEQQEFVDNLSLAVEKQKRIAAEINKSADATSDQKKNEDAFLKSLEKSLVAEQKILGKKKAQLKESEQEAEKQKTIVGLTKEKLNEASSQLREGYSAFTELTDILQDTFGTFSDGMQDVLDNIGGVVDGIATVENGLSKILDGKVITGALGVVTGMFKTIGGLFGIGSGDKRKERQIKKEQKLVEDLERSYEKLEKAIEDAYSLDTLKSATKMSKDNINAQIRSYQKMIATEEDKKKTDQDRIKEWKNNIEDLKEQLKELDDQAFSTATGGILDNVLDASKEWTDAWFNAFAETGKGMTGLEDNFKEMMQSILRQQAAMTISNRWIDGWKRQLEQYVNADDMYLTTDEAKRWADSIRESLPGLNNALEAYFNAMKEAGIDISNGTSNLSGLSQGISQASEETMLAVEGYLNSIRFFVSEQNNILQGIAVKIGTYFTESPMLSELRSQTELIKSIRDMFGSVIRNGHPTYGGSFLKVAL